MMQINAEMAHAIFSAIATSCFEGYTKKPKNLDFDINLATKDVVDRLREMYPGIYNMYEVWIKDQL